VRSSIPEKKQPSRPTAIAAASGAAKRNPVEPVMPRLRFKISIANIAPARPPTTLLPISLNPLSNRFPVPATSAPVIIPSEAKLTYAGCSLHGCPMVDRGSGKK
jgi:hypothetical protein